MHRGEQRGFDAWTQLEDPEQPLDRFLSRCLPRRRRRSRRRLYRRTPIRVQLEKNVDRAALELSLQPSPERVHRQRIVLVLEWSECFSLARQHPTREMVDEPREECLFIGEMIVDERLAHPSVSRDLAQCERGGAVRRDATRGRVQDSPRCGMISVFGVQRTIARRRSAAGTRPSSGRRPVTSSPAPSRRGFAR